MACYSWQKYNYQKNTDSTCRFTWMLIFAVTFKHWGSKKVNYAEIGPTIIKFVGFKIRSWHLHIYVRFMHRWAS